MAERIAVRLDLKLHENQQKIHESTARFKVEKCGKRFGKTKLAVFELIQKSQQVNNGTFWYLAPTYNMAKDIAWRDFKNIIPRDMLKFKPRETDLELEFWNGSIIRLKGCDNIDSLRGPGLDGLILDECAMINGDLWFDILRSQIMDRKGFCYFISTPRGRNWFTTLFNDAQRRRMAGDWEWEAFHYTTWDNPHIDRVEIEKAKDETPNEAKFMQEYMAIEFEASGIMYPEFEYSKNVGRCESGNTLQWVRGIDWGIRHPTVCLWVGVDINEKIVYVCDEYAKSDNTIRESCDVIKDMNQNRPIEWTVIDPSCAKRNSQTNRRDMDEFSRWGVTCIPADNSERGVDILKMFFKRGMLKIHPKCQKLIYELQHLNWEDKENDDMSDALRYICIRINDYFYGMNILNIESKPYFERSKNPREMNFNDPLLFPKENKDLRMNWVEQEIYSMNG